MQGGKPSPLTILFLTSMHPSDAFPLRGVIVTRFASALRRMGHRVEFVQLGLGSPFRYLVGRRQVAEAIRALDPDIIHVHFGYSGLALPSTSVPVVTTFYGDDLNGKIGRRGWPTLKSRLGILASHYVAWRSHRCIAVSATLRDRLWTARLRTRAVVVRDAVDPAVFRPLPRAAARDRLKIGSGEVLVLFPHDVTQPVKRIGLAEAATAELQKRLPAARLWVVNGIPADEMPWYYAAADAMLVTSICEGGPSSAKEALACGIPVVSVPVGDMELFRDAPDHMRAAPPVPAALAGALYEVLTRSTGPRHSLLPEGLTLVDAAKSVVTLYREIIAEGRTGSS